MMAMYDETEFEKAVRVGELVHPEKILQYHIDKFNMGGIEKPVKVMPTEAVDREYVSGFFTQQKFVMGRTPTQMEHDLGLNPGDLKNGATIYELAETPSAGQFVPAGYTHMPGGRFYEAGQKYPIGTGAIQFKLKADVPAKVIGKVNYDQPWKAPSAMEKANVTSQFTPEASVSESETEFAQSTGELPGNATAEPVGGKIGEVASEFVGEAESESLEVTGQSKESPTDAAGQSVEKNSTANPAESEEGNTYGYGYGH